MRIFRSVRTRGNTVDQTHHVVFADTVTVGMVIVEKCGVVVEQSSNPFPSCQTTATTHRPGAVHRLTVLDLRNPSRYFINAVVTDEDGNQQPWTCGGYRPIRVLAPKPRPEDDPTRIDWAARQAAAVIPFQVVDGRPVNPCEHTGIPRGRGQLKHWGEALCADALVEANDLDGHLWIVMVERGDGHGWALPGGHVDPGETPVEAAIRELAEETGLTLPDATWYTKTPRYVPDPRASDEAWMVTVPSRTHIGRHDLRRLPKVRGADDARYAAWVLADTYDTLSDYLVDTFLGQVFPAHRRMLADLLDGSA